MSESKMTSPVDMPTGQMPSNGEFVQIPSLLAYDSIAATTLTPLEVIRPLGWIALLYAFATFVARSGEIEEMIWSPDFSQSRVDLVSEYLYLLGTAGLFIGGILLLARLPWSLRLLFWSAVAMLLPFAYELLGPILIGAWYGPHHFYDRLNRYSIGEFRDALAYNIPAIAVPLCMVLLCRHRAMRASPPQRV